jgi:hypothetical protein
MFFFLYINDLLRHLEFKIKLISKWLLFFVNYLNIFIALLEGNPRARKTWPISKTIQSFTRPLRWSARPVHWSLMVHHIPSIGPWQIFSTTRMLKYDILLWSAMVHNFIILRDEILFLWPVPWKRLRTTGILWHGKRLFRSLYNWKSHFVSKNSGHDPAMIRNNWEMNEIQRLNFILENFVFKKISLHFMISELNKYS